MITLFDGSAASPPQAARRTPQVERTTQLPPQDPPQRPPATCSSSASESSSLSTAWNRTDEWLLVAVSVRRALSSWDNVPSWTISKQIVDDGLDRTQELTKVPAHGAYRQHRVAVVGRDH